MSHSIYPIQLLNDIHNYFPDILYNPGRFRNVQDLLDYIRTGADVNPYTRGMNLYNSTLRSNTIHNNNVNIPRNVTNVPLNTTWNPTIITATFDDISTANNQNNILNSLFSTLIRETAPDNLQSFLDQRVAVYPTNQEIMNATTLYILNRRNDETCAICQEILDINQEIRRVNYCNHQFHRNCIDVWFQTNVHCPNCRHDIRQTNNRNNQTQNNRTV